MQDDARHTPVPAVPDLCRLLRCVVRGGRLENGEVQISFLLGPAGSGKTFRCLSEIRSELARDPEGLPLIFLAPKQATFQLERQLFEKGDLKGYSRLHILSFERLARFVHEATGRPLPKFVSEEGRTMVLRALLYRLEGQFGVLRGAAARQGFAKELGAQLREFTNHGLTPERLRKLAGEVPAKNSLPAKLRDFALIYEHYLRWLAERKLQDSDALLGVTADLLAGGAIELRIAGLWLDGFAQLTPEERRLLAHVLRFTERATLAFCVENEPAPSRVSPWFLVSQMYSKTKLEIETRLQCKPDVEFLSRDAAQNRFDASPALACLERNWARRDRSQAEEPCGDAIQLIECSDPEAEAVCCAREIVRFVRAGGRFREAAVLLRGFQNDYPYVLRRTFQRYGIPCFVDHRESIAHHPLAELTRGALRTVLYDWEPKDWFAVLKSGLMDLAPGELDKVENESLARGWKGAVWRDGLGKDDAFSRDFDRWRERVVAPFLRLRLALRENVTGRELAEALRSLWKALGVQERLEEWAQDRPEDKFHSTVWDQMSSWLDALELAFTDQRLSLRQWIPILEAGLSSLTVGIIPPVLDEVLIGSVDRSRNPDLKLLCVLGFNEKVFPASPGRDTLLTENDREQLLVAGSDLAHAPALKLAAEQFYGYIACTRAREWLRISYSRSGLDGKPLNPSRFTGQIQQIFPELKPISWNYPASLAELVHPCELPLLGFVSDAHRLVVPAPDETLAPETVRALYGDSLDVAVSALERFASCPFRFFVERGLKIREREEFRLDIREQGSFQHAVLAKFHEEATRHGGEWKDLDTEEARALIGRIADEEMAIFRNGLLLANEQNKFTGATYKAALQDFIEAVVGYFRTTNRFSPKRVEFAFGGDSGLPGWRVELCNGRSIVIQGRVDRLDLHETENGTLLVIIDYKSGVLEPNRLLIHHGIQQQLTAYLLALAQIPEIAEHLGQTKLVPAGCFYVPLAAKHEKINTRRDIAPDKAAALETAYVHNGVFNAGYLKILDEEARAGRKAQFRYSVTQDLQPLANGINAQGSARFAAILERAETLVREIGESIFAGEISVRPYKAAGSTACEKCRMLPVCRFDPWTQPYKQLTKPS